MTEPTPLTRCAKCGELPEMNVSGAGMVTIECVACGNGVGPMASMPDYRTPGTNWERLSSSWNNKQTNMIGGL